MPRDSAGVYTLPAGNPVVDNTVIESTWANPTMGDIANQLNNLLTRDGLLGPTTPFKLIDGTVGIPSLTFASAPTLGFFRKTAVSMGVALAGLELGYWDAAGYHGAVNGGSHVGSVSLPDGTALLPSLFFTDNPNTGMWSPATNTIAWSVGGIERMRLLTNGVLSTLSSGNGIAQFASSVVGGFGEVTIISDDRALVLGLRSSTNPSGELAYIIPPNTSPLAFFAGGIERVRVTPAGDLLVNTVTATERFTVWQGNAFILRTGGAKLRLSDQNNEVSVESLPVGGGSEMLFRVGTTERMRIDSSGDIRMTNSLDVDGALNVDGTTNLRATNFNSSSLSGVANIGGFSNAGAYTVWGGFDAINGGFLQLFGGSHPGSPNTILLGDAVTGETLRVNSGGVTISKPTTINVPNGSDGLTVASGDESFGVILRGINANAAVVQAVILHNLSDVFMGNDRIDSGSLTLITAGTPRLVIAHGGAATFTVALQAPNVSPRTDYANLTGSRVMDTNYTNSNAFAVDTLVQVITQPNGTVQLLVNGGAVCGFSNPDPLGAQRLTLQARVPPGGTIQCLQTTATSAIQSWFEW